MFSSKQNYAINQYSKPQLSVASGFRWRLDIFIFKLELLYITSFVEAILKFYNFQLTDVLYDTVLHQVLPAEVCVVSVLQLIDMVLLQDELTVVNNQ